MPSMVAVVIPAYNEGRSIGKVVREVKELGADVIVVDDGSWDNTRDEAERAGAVVVKHIVNVGVGLATVTGNEYAVKRGYKLVANIDADEQHSPGDIPKALKHLEENSLDIVFGSRFLGDTTRFPLILKIGNKFLTYVNRTFFGVRVTDSQTGFRLMKAEAWQKLGIKSPGYSICSEIAAKAGQRGLKSGEIPVATVFLDKFKGTTIFDGMKIFVDMVKWKVKR